MDDLWYEMRSVLMCHVALQLRYLFSHKSIVFIYNPEYVRHSKTVILTASEINAYILFECKGGLNVYVLFMTKNIHSISHSKLKC